MNLVIIDCQNDFVHGALAAVNGEETVDAIVDFLKAHDDLKVFIVWTSTLQTTVVLKTKEGPGQLTAWLTLMGPRFMKSLVKQNIRRISTAPTTRAGTRTGKSILPLMRKMTWAISYGMTWKGPFTWRGLPVNIALEKQPWILKRPAGRLSS